MNDDDLDSLNDTELWLKWIESPEGKAREKLHEALTDLSIDPDITASPLCAAFLNLMVRLSPADPELDKVSDLIEPLTAYFNKLQARKNAMRGHAEKNKAKTFVQLEWATHRDSYDGNKSEFCRHYVKRVFNEFEVSVTEKQMREVWLKNTRSASKQAGELAGG